jgi:hypothetical protein
MRRRFAAPGHRVTGTISLLAVVLGMLVPVEAWAQDASHWGVVGAISPAQSWNAIQELTEYLFEHEGSANIKSTDFTIGIARGRERGGDWGVSFVRRTLKDGSRFEADTDVCTSSLNASGGFDEVCSTEPSSLLLTRGVTYSGIELHKFVPFVTIKRRVQVGMNFAGGIGAFDGDLEDHEYGQNFVFTGNSSTVQNTETVTTRPARDFVTVSPFPLGKIEAAVAVVAARGLKIRGSGGFSFPGYQKLTITGVYLFGAE